MDKFLIKTINNNKKSINYLKIGLIKLIINKKGKTNILHIPFSIISQAKPEKKKNKKMIWGRAANWTV